MRYRSVRPFTVDDIPVAGRLLAARHRDHLARQPYLDPVYAEVDRAAAEVGMLWRTGAASGSVLLDGDTMVGYMLGVTKNRQRWGPNVWVESAGFAAPDADALRLLYGGAAQSWVDQGRVAHYALTPAGDPEMEHAWWTLAFGLQHFHAARAPIHTPPHLPDGVSVRQGVQADIPALARLDQVLPQHQRQSPVFRLQLGVPDVREGEAEWHQEMDAPTLIPFVAEYRGEIVGSAIGADIEMSSIHFGLLRPDHAGFVGYVAVLPDYRRIGIGKALGESLLYWAGQEGYRSVAADWRATNLTSGPTWSGLGFESTFLRVHRHVGF